MPISKLGEENILHGVSCQKHICQVLSKFAKWLRICFIKLIVDGERKNKRLTVVNTSVWRKYKYLSISCIFQLLKALVRVHP